MLGVRKKRLIYNSAAAIIQEIVTLLCGFILPRQILLYFGSEINGLVSSITQFLGFVTLLDMGVGAVVQSSLYKPLAQNDQERISAIMISARKFFNIIAIALLVYTVVLMVFYPLLVSNVLGKLSTAILVFAIAVSSIAQYFFGITNQLLLNADQKSYIPLLSQTLVTALNTIFGVILIHIGSSIVIVKLVASAVLLLRPLILTIYVKTHYQINFRLKFSYDPISQKWNAMAQHIATFVLDKTDIIVLTILSTLTNVSIYYVYNLVTFGVSRFFLAMTTGIQALFGDMYARDEKNKLKETYTLFEWLAHTGMVFLFLCTGILIIPFVTVYTDGISDANYIQPVFSIIFVVAFGIYCVRCYYNLIIKAVGHYKQTQNCAILEAVINLVVSIVLVWRFGLVGVAVGTLVAVTYRTIYFIWYIHKNIIDTRYEDIIKLLTIDILSCIIVIALARFIKLGCISYYAWAIMAIKVILIALGAILCVNFVFYRKNLIDLVYVIKKRK